jgi:hypothetical protein
VDAVRTRDQGRVAQGGCVDAAYLVELCGRDGPTGGHGREHRNDRGAEAPCLLGHPVLLVDRGRQPRRLVVEPGMSSPGEQAVEVESAAPAGEVVTTTRHRRLQGVGEVEAELARVQGRISVRELIHGYLLMILCR